MDFPMTVFLSEATDVGPATLPPANLPTNMGCSNSFASSEWPISSNAWIDLLVRNATCLCSVTAGLLHEHLVAAGMLVQELCNVIHLAVDHHVAVIWQLESGRRACAGMFGHLFCSQGHHSHAMREKLFID